MSNGVRYFREAGGDIVHEVAPGAVSINRRLFYGSKCGRAQFDSDVVCDGPSNCFNCMTYEAPFAIINPCCEVFIK